MTQGELDSTLIDAACFGKLDEIKECLSQGAYIHARNDMALRYAAEFGRLDTVKYLVEQGADIHAQDDDALEWAMANGHHDVVTYLSTVEHHYYLKKEILV